MNISSKIKKIIIVLLIITVSVVIVFYFINNKSTICTLNGKNKSFYYYNKITINKDYLLLNYKYIYGEEDVETSSDKYDSISQYLDLISNNDMIVTEINQNKNIIEYSINVSLKNKEILKKDNPYFLEITDIKNFSKKELIKYYEQNKYSCN